MNKEELCNSSCSDQIHLAEAELSAFIGAVTELFGREQARLSAEDWLEEAELMACPPPSTSRDWRAVTVAAAARLANRLTVAGRQRAPLDASTDAKISPMPSPSEFLSAMLA